MEAVDLRALAAVTAETMVTHILSRLAERPAGIGALTSKHVPSHSTRAHLQ